MAQVPTRQTEGDLATAADLVDRTSAEAALRESEQKYRSLFESMDEAYAVVEVLKDQDGNWADFRFLEVNPAFVAHTAMSDPVGKTATEILGSPNPRWAQLHGQALDTGQPIRVEESEGTLGRTFDLNIFSLDRERNRVAVLFTNITERKRQEEALRESEEKLRLIVESARDYAIFTTDENDLIDNWLPGAESVFGWTKAEAEGQPAAILYTAEDRANGVPVQEIETARREGKAPDVRWHVHKSGRLVFIEGQVVPLRSSGGDVRGFLKIGRDTTEDRTAEDALRTSEERFRQFADASLDSLWIRDAETLVFEYLSPAFERLYGVPRDQVLQANDVRAWLELIHPDDRDGAVAALRELRNGVPKSHEFRAIHPDGQVRWIHNTDFPMLDDHGKVQRIAGIAHDVTDRRRAVELQGTLLAELQHRVRNVLAMIRSIVLRTSSSKSDIEDFVEHFQGRIDAMARTQSLLTRTPGRGVDLEDIIRDEMVAQAAQEPKFKLCGGRVSLAPQSAEVLTLALHELATNSVKYGALGQNDGRVTISWKVKADGGSDWLEINWRETGIRPHPERASGFGTELITRRVPYELSGLGELVFDDSSLTARIGFPLRPGHGILEMDPTRLMEQANG